MWSSSCIDHGADLNTQDTFYSTRALDMAGLNDHDAVAMLLIEKGSQGEPATGPRPGRQGNPDPRAALAGQRTDERSAWHRTRRTPSGDQRGSPELIERSWRRCRRAPAVTVDACCSRTSARIATTRLDTR